MNSNAKIRFPWLFDNRNYPLCIAHRGASDYAYGNSALAFEKAALLGADYWEIDIRTTRDGILVAHHDANILTSAGESAAISDLTCAELIESTTHDGQPIELLANLLDMANRLSAGVYIDAKDEQAVRQSPTLLAKHNIKQAIMACFDTNMLSELATAGCDYPLAAMVPLNSDPFALAEQTGADIIHLCWEHGGSEPQNLVTPELLREARDKNLAVVLWHEERLDIAAHLLALPVFGICTNRPEILKPYSLDTNKPVQVVCHRGHNKICPENSLPAAHCAFGAGYDFVEIDVHTTADGELVVIHDETVDRTTDGEGLVREYTSASIDLLNAGTWFHSFHKNTRVPRFSEMLELAAFYKGSLYVEIKTATVQDVIAQVAQYDMLDMCFFWSYKQHYLTEVREQCPNAQIMVRRKDYPTLAKAIEFANANIIEFDEKCDDLSEIKSCKNANCKTMVAYNGHDENRFKEILEFSPELINIDNLAAFRRSLLI